jgi:ABC-type multidrug transport system fused ATPase/permease subunit
VLDVIATIRRAARLIEARYRRRLALLAVANVAVSALDLLGILLLVPFLAFLGPGGIQGGFIVDTAREYLGSSSAEHIVLVLAFAATLLFVVKGVAAVSLLWIQTGQLNAAQVALANRVLRGFVEAPWLAQQDSSTGGLIRTTVTSVQSTIGVLGSAIVMIAEGSVFLAVFAALLIINPVLAVAALLYLGLAGLAYIWLVRRPIERRGAQLQHQSERMNSSLIELAGGIKELTIRGSAGQYLGRYSLAISTFLSAFRLITVTNQAMRYLLEILMIAGAAFVIGFAYLSGSTTTVLVSMGVLLTAGFRVLPALNMLLFSVNTIRSYESAVSVVESEIRRLDTRPAQHGDSETPVVASRTFAPTGSFAFDGVRYRYPTRDIDAVRDLSMSVEAGEAIGIVGASGSGKSTVVDLLLGLLQPIDGRIMIDGEPLHDYVELWRESIGFVPQDIFLIDDTLAANIEFGHRLGRDESRLVEALHLAHLDGVVDQLPDGVHTMLGERGVRMSGGQRQRIGLARALYGSPSLLILDEATSALDNETEQLIGEALQELHGRMTMVVIAHRLSTVRSCDRIVYLEGGRISGVGTFDELDKTNEGFARLVELGSLRGAF